MTLRDPQLRRSCATWSNYSVPQRPHVTYHATSCGCMARERMIAIRVRPVSTVDELADAAVSRTYGTSDPGKSVQVQVCGPVPTSGVDPEVSMIVRTHSRVHILLVWRESMCLRIHSGKGIRHPNEPLVLTRFGDNYILHPRFRASFRTRAQVGRGSHHTHAPDLLPAPERNAPKHTTAG